jgi:hypothetical protein
MKSKEQVRIDLENALKDRPYVFRSDKLRQALDGSSGAVLSNLDCRGGGPANPFMIGKKIAYHRSDYIEWVVGRITGIKGGTHES